MDDAERLLRDAEDQIEAWLCELDATWTRILADARVEAAQIIALANEHSSMLIAAAAEQSRLLVNAAEARAAKAEHEATSLLAGSARLARMQLAEADAEVARARALAAESSATAETLSLAADAAARGHVETHDLAALAEAVVRLRTELSRVVDAAFDALPAVEATASALHVDPARVELPEPAPKPKVGFVRRLLRI
jgi:hypothetical protein